MEKEKWLPIKGFEKYKISDYGRVFNTKRGSFRKSHPLPNGYLHITLSKDNIKYPHLIHRLVALHFLPSSEHNNVNHKDFNRLNNHVDNLEWVDAKQNSRYSTEAGNLQKKLTREQMTAMHTEYASGSSISELMEKYNVSKSYTYKVVKGYHLMPRKD